MRYWAHITALANGRQHDVEREMDTLIMLFELLFRMSIFARASMLRARCMPGIMDIAMVGGGVSCLLPQATHRAAALVHRRP